MLALQPQGQPTAQSRTQNLKSENLKAKTKMKTKTFSAVCLTLALLGAFLPGASAQVADKTGHSAGGTAGTTVSSGILSSRGNTGNAPTVTYVSATSDKSTSKILFYNVATSTGITGANTTTSIPVTATNGFAANDILIIEHQTTDTYERRIVSSVTATAVVVTVAPTTATVSGDVLHDCTTASSIPVGAATVSAIGNGIYVGQAKKPLLVEVDGTSACTLNAVTANYR